MSISSALPPNSLIGLLCNDLWDICGSYLPKNEMTRLWALLGNPERGFSQVSPTITRLFQEKVASLPSALPLPEQIDLQRVYQHNLIGWKLDELPTLLSKVHNIQFLSSNRVITQESVGMYNQYYVLTFSDQADQVISKIPLGDATFFSDTIAELAPDDFVMTSKNNLHSDTYKRSHIGRWRLAASEKPDTPGQYVRIATSEELVSAYVIKVLPHNRIVCAVKDTRKIKVFNHALKLIFEFKPDKFYDGTTLQVLQDGRIVFANYLEEIFIWSLRGRDHALKAVCDSEVSCRYFTGSRTPELTLLQDGRVACVFNYNMYDFWTSPSYICLLDPAPSGKKVLYSLEENEKVKSITTLATGQIACGIENRGKSYIKVWPLDHSNNPKIIVRDTCYFVPFSDGGLAVPSYGKGYQIVRPVFDEEALKKLRESDQLPCPIL